MHLCVDACIDWNEAGNGRETKGFIILETVFSNNFFELICLV